MRADPAGVRTVTMPVLALALLLLAVMLAFVPGQAEVPPIDRDEPRFTQATKQMLETKDFVAINFQEEPRHKKPVGIHWLQAASAALAGGTEAPLWAYRLPSLFAALASVLLAVWVAQAFLPLGPALVVGVLFGASVVLGVEARLAKTDAALLSTVLLAQGALARLWLGARERWLAALFWLAVAFSILIKGPIGPMIVGLTVAALALLRGNGVLSRLRPVMGLVIVAAVALPWYVAIAIRTDGAFFAAAVGEDLMAKAASGQEGHGAPPLTHLALFFVVAWPLAPFALAAAGRIWRQRSPAVLFCAAWVVPAWIVFEAVPTKLAHYTMPLLPGVALAAVASLSAAAPPRALRRIAAAFVVAVPLAVAGAGAFGLAYFGMVQSAADLARWPVPLSLALIGLSVIAAVAAAHRVAVGAPMLSARTLAPAIAASVMAQAAVWGLALPSLSPIWLTPHIVAAVQAVAPCDDPHVVSAGYYEPSLVFLAGTDSVLAEPSRAMSRARQCSVFVVRAELMPEFDAARDAAGLQLSQVGRVDGFNISKGEWLQLSLFIAQDRTMVEPSTP